MKVRAVDSDVEAYGVYDSYDEVRQKSLAFIAEWGMTQAAFLRRIGGVAANTWNKRHKI